MYYEVGANQIQGGRDYQEDCYQVYFPEPDNLEKKQALVVLADGMGGHAGGATASEIVVEEVIGSFSKDYPADRYPDALLRATEAANRAIQQRAREQPELQGMGCTLVAFNLDQNELHWVSVGDSLLYLIRAGEVIRKNDDHSYGGYVDRLIAAGENIPETPGFRPRRNMLMSYLNGEEIAMTDCPQKASLLQAGDRLIVASDGLDTISVDDFPFLSKNAPTAQAFADALVQAVQAANKNNQDNTTVVVVDVIGSIGDDTTQETPGDWVGDTFLPGLDEEDSTLELAIPADQTVEEEKAAKPVFKPLSEKGAIVDQAVASAGSETAAGKTPRRRQRKTKTIALAVLFLALLLTSGGYFFLSGDRALPRIGSAPDDRQVSEGSRQQQQQPVKIPAEIASVTPTAVEKQEPTQPRLKTLQDRLENGGKGKGPRLVILPAGRFIQGSSTLSPVFTERPAREVALPEFAISANEITFAEYAAFAAAVGRRLPANQGWGRNQRPIINVSWDDARAYAAWLSSQTGHRYRLPSESEWEYAARAGTTQPYWWGHQPDTNRANCWGCGSQWDGVKTAPVGSFPPNPWGIYDTSGNVFEWVADCMHKSYDDAPVNGSSWQQADCTERVIRGGSWSNPPDNGRVARREGMPASVRQDNLGFRLVRELD